MAYNYIALRQEIFTDGGQRLFLTIRDRVDAMLKESGAFMLNFALGSGDSWEQIACIDRLVELNEIQEITDDECVAAQHRVFVRKNKS